MSLASLAGVKVGYALPRPGEAPADRDVLLTFDEHGTFCSPPHGSERPLLIVPDALALPALSNGHDHGQAISALGYGVVDDVVEFWLPTARAGVPLDQRLTSLAFFARAARSGIAATVNLHALRPPQRLLAEAVTVAAAAEQIGVRCAFTVPLQDRQFLAYATTDAERFILDSCGVAPEHLNVIAKEVPSTREAMETVDAIDAAIGSDLVTVQYGPLGPQWASDGLLAAVAERSADTGRRVHMHLLETRLQREWADARFAGGLVEHLDRLGLLSPRLSVAHGVWLRRHELELLADRGVSVAVNISSNLRLRSGSAPVADMLELGVPMAIGLDGGAFDDDADMLRELRLVSRLHAGHDFIPRVTPSQLYRSAIEVGARVVHGGRGAWGFEAGRPADVVMLSRSALSGDMMEPYRDRVEAVLARATTAHVSHLVVAGRLVVAEGVVQGVDEPALLAELRTEFLAATKAVERSHALMAPLAPALFDFYVTGGHTTRSEPTADPTSGETT
jgi:cytosine/adenosine deaminase-related metal-dependent hydrolase